MKVSFDDLRSLAEEVRCYDYERNLMARQALDSLNTKPRHEWRTDYLGSSTPVVMSLQDKLLLLEE
jgi:hypothetical protein